MAHSNNMVYANGHGKRWPAGTTSKKKNYAWKQRLLFRLPFFHLSRQLGVLQREGIEPRREGELQTRFDPCDPTTFPLNKQGQQACTSS